VGSALDELFIGDFVYDALRAVEVFAQEPRLSNQFDAAGFQPFG